VKEVLSIVSVPFFVETIKPEVDLQILHGLDAEHLA
jgi:hypothetical protein